MKRSAVFLAVALVASWALLCTLTFAAVGQAIRFDDTALNDTISVTADLNPAIFLNVATSNGFQDSGSPYVTGGPLVEFGRVTFFIADGEGFAGIGDFVLAEPSTDPFNQPISDIFFIVATAVSDGVTGTAYDLFFESDYLGSPQLLPNLPPPSPVTELAGGNLFELTFPTNATGGTTIVPLELVSDVNNPEVPEPSTFLLVGAGLMGVGFLRRRFKK